MSTDAKRSTHRCHRLCSGGVIATALLYDRGGFDVERSKEKPRSHHRLEGVALAIARDL
jgi:hypothetical protein